MGVHPSRDVCLSKLMLILITLTVTPRVMKTSPHLTAFFLTDPTSFIPEVLRPNRDKKTVLEGIFSPIT